MKRPYDAPPQVEVFQLSNTLHLLSDLSVESEISLEVIEDAGEW